MGKEKTTRRHNIIWALPGIGNFFNYILRRSNNSDTFTVSLNLRGFTLVELIVSIGIIGMLAAALALIVQPQKQLNKAWDATRLSDITKIRTAADLYYDSNNCYPVTIPFGSEWRDDSGTVYMSKVPQDPEHGRDSTRSYLYQNDETNCSQWNVLYGKLTYSTNKATTLCPLQQMSNCLPPGYANSGYNYCVVSGTADCGYIASTPLSGLPTSPSTPTPTPIPPLSGGTPTPTPTPPGGGTPIPTPTPTPVPTPTPSPTPPGCTKKYACLDQGGGRISCQDVGAGNPNATYCNSNCDGVCQ